MEIGNSANYSYKSFLKQVFLLFMAILFITVYKSPAFAKTVRLKTASLYVGNGRIISIKKEKEKIKWSSTKPEVASVNSKGLIIGKGNGKTKIIGKTKKRKYVCKVLVREKPVKKKGSFYIRAGELKKVTDTGPSLTKNWQTADLSLTISKDGKVRHYNSGI